MRPREQNDVTFIFEHFSLSQVRKEINNINIYKSSGIENLSSRIIKDSFIALLSQIRHILNLSVKSMTFPGDWKKAKVVPIPKNKNPTDVGDLRPISLLPIIGKILERLVYNQLSKYLECYNLLTNKQNGFRKGRGTIDTVFKLVGDIHTSLNANKKVLAVYIDFKKAFDTISHVILIKKLETFGFDKSVINWFRSYLSERKQHTIANGRLSTWKEVTYGVPQGSILGPLLFLLYVNDLPSINLNSDIGLYADDTVLTCTGTNMANINSKIQQDMDKIVCWCNNNLLTINVNKTKSMLFTYAKNPSAPVVKILGQTLANVDTYKYLGVTLDRRLQFKTHLSNTYKILNHKLWLFRKIRNSLNQAASLMIYKTMILPYLDMGNIYYTGLPLNDLKKLQTVQNIALRICFNIKDPLLVTTKELHLKANLLPLYYRRKYLLLTVCYRLVSNKSLKTITGRSTRAGTAPLLFQFTPRINRTRSCPIYTATTFWNTLPPLTRLINNKDAFKRNVSKLLRNEFRNS